jgi:hypothetical protein
LRGSGNPIFNTFQKIGVFVWGQRVIGRLQ